MEQKNQRNSRKRLNSLILLVAFTAIMLIVSTYAWFSINKNVSINNLTGTVNVVEGLQISLDAENWSSEIDLETLSIIDDAYSGNKNFAPSELLPVSTTGKAVVGDKLTELVMYRGTNTGTVELTDILATDFTVTDTSTEQNKAKYPGYYAFDIFLMNTTNETSDEVLQLNSDSTLALTKTGGEKSGLQNTVRVGFAQFSGTADVTDVGTDATNKTNAATSYISDVSIWEPNADKHISNIVNTNNKIMLDSTTAAAWPGMSQSGNYYTFTETTKVPTYALTSVAATDGSNSISNIYDWKASAADVDAGKLAMQYTVQTAAGATPIMNLKSTKDGATNFTIPANKIVKIRVYVWLEGQDVDCTNYASHGGGIDLNIGFIKGATATN